MNQTWRNNGNGLESLKSGVQPQAESVGKGGSGTCNAAENHKNCREVGIPRCLW